MRERTSERADPNVSSIAAQRSFWRSQAPARSLPACTSSDSTPPARHGLCGGPSDELAVLHDRIAVGGLPTRTQRDDGARDMMSEAPCNSPRRSPVFPLSRSSCVQRASPCPSPPAPLQSVSHVSQQQNAAASQQPEQPAQPAAHMPSPRMEGARGPKWQRGAAGRQRSADSPVRVCPSRRRLLQERRGGRRRKEIETRWWCKRGAGAEPESHERQRAAPRRCELLKLRAA